MRAAVQTKKSKRGLKILVAVILILGVLALAFKFVLYDKLKDKAFYMVTKDVVQQMIEENPQLAEDTDIDSIISSVSSEDKAKVEIIAGINLPMLIKLASLRKDKSLKEAVEGAQEAGKKYINVASKLLGM